jgi:hypothetical protein
MGALQFFIADPATTITMCLSADPAAAATIYQARGEVLNVDRHCERSDASQRIPMGAIKFEAPHWIASSLRSRHDEPGVGPPGAMIQQTIGVQRVARRLRTKHGQNMANSFKLYSCWKHFVPVAIWPLQHGTNCAQ